jgi:hypothetical protein
LRPPTGEGDRSAPGDRERDAERGDIDRIGDFEIALRERDCDRVGERPRDALPERKGVGDRDPDDMVAEMDLYKRVGIHG